MNLVNTGFVHEANYWKYSMPLIAVVERDCWIFVRQSSYCGRDAGLYWYFQVMLAVLLCPLLEVIHCHSHIANIIRNM